ncbi:uncharacterized protein EV154DRAFT_492608 [Mucor mucedo]|uniref:uncharacterized protein n=1 Tax=Mucor mucedo TaxID=29922 RepID=UPI002220987D|nr:uncharacterized protein EV154DRAFT_492608 [Mucor mucedo]KAI7896171.1 hypothetical protein EV154DRAFT_492608 [Mucor mucedo]
MKICLLLLLLLSLLTLAHSLVVIRDDMTLFSNGKNDDLFTVTYNSCYVKLPDESYCIVTGVEHSTCNHHQLGVPNKCNDQLTDCKACLNNFQNMQRAETQRNFGIWCDQKNGYITEYNSSSPVCK